MTSSITQFFPLNDLRLLMDPEFVAKQKIQCIKYLRFMTGEGLRETKDFFEKEWEPFVRGRQSSSATRPTVRDAPLNPEFDALVEQVAQLTEEVYQLKRNQTQTMARSIFSDS